MLETARGDTMGAFKNTTSCPLCGEILTYEIYQDQSDTIVCGGCGIVMEIMQHYPFTVTEAELIGCCKDPRE
jgi:hypothetical protein